MDKIKIKYSWQSDNLEDLLDDLKQIDNKTNDDATSSIRNALKVLFEMIDEYEY